MAFYSPNSLEPINTEIIATEDNDFTWQNNFGASPQVKYNIFINKISDNSQVYTSTLTTSATALHTVPSGTLTAGTDYKWMVNSYYDSTNYRSSDWQVVYARGAATLTLSSTPSTSQNYTFQFLYDHPQNVAVKTYQIDLYEGTTLVDSSGQTYPSGLVYTSATPLSHTVSGMISGTEYNINCTVISQEDKVITSGSTTFTVIYESFDPLPSLTITAQNDSASLKLEWYQLTQILGQIVGDYQFPLAVNKRIFVSSLGLTSDSIQIELDVGTTGDFIEYSNDSMPGYKRLFLTDASGEIYPTNMLIPINFTSVDDIILDGDPLTNTEYNFTVSYKRLHLNSGATLTYSNNITIPQNFTQIFEIELASDFVGDFIQYDSNFKVGYNGSKFYYDSPSRITAGLPRTIPTDSFIIVIQPYHVRIYSDEYIEVLR